MASGHTLVNFYFPGYRGYEDHLDKLPNDYCRIPGTLMTKCLPKEEPRHGAYSSDSQ